MLCRLDTADAAAKASSAASTASMKAGLGDANAVAPAGCPGVEEVEVRRLLRDLTEPGVVLDSTSAAVEKVMRWFGRPSPSPRPMLRRAAYRDLNSTSPSSLAATHSSSASAPHSSATSSPSARYSPSASSASSSSASRAASSASAGKAKSSS